MEPKKDDLVACVALARYIQAIEDAHDKLNDLAPHEPALSRLFGTDEFATVCVAGVSGLRHMLGDSENTKSVKPVIKKLQDLIVEFNTEAAAD